MRSRYQVQFESQMNSGTALNNYEYLDLLDRAWIASGRTPPAGGELHDVGCASFWYAAALQAFFAPAGLVGVDVEGYRLFENGHTRIDHANGYLEKLPNAKFIIADYARCAFPADIVTAWFPFVTPAPVLAWRLPLSLLAPQRLFDRMFHNLRVGASLVMVNHGPTEAGIAQDLCAATGFRFDFAFSEPGVLSRSRPLPAVLSHWIRP